MTDQPEDGCALMYLLCLSAQGKVVTNAIWNLLGQRRDAEPGHGEDVERGGADPGDRPDRTESGRGRARRVRDRRASQPAVLLVLAADAVRAYRRVDEADHLEHRGDAGADKRPGQDRRGLV